MQLNLSGVPNSRPIDNSQRRFSCAAFGRMISRLTNCCRNPETNSHENDIELNEQSVNPEARNNSNSLQQSRPTGDTSSTEQVNDPRYNNDSDFKLRLALGVTTFGVTAAVAVGIAVTVGAPVVAAAVGCGFLIGAVVLCIRAYRSHRRVAQTPSALSDPDLASSSTASSPNPERAASASGSNPERAASASGSNIERASSASGSNPEPEPEPVSVLVQTLELIQALISEFPKIRTENRVNAITKTIFHAFIQTYNQLIQIQMRLLKIDENQNQNQNTLQIQAEFLASSLLEAQAAAEAETRTKYRLQVQAASAAATATRAAYLTQAQAQAQAQAQTQVQVQAQVRAQAQAQARAQAQVQALVSILNLELIQIQALALVQALAKKEEINGQNLKLASELTKSLSEQIQKIKSKYNQLPIEECFAGECYMPNPT